MARRRTLNPPNKQIFQIVPKVTLTISYSDPENWHRDPSNFCIISVKISYMLGTPGIEIESLLEQFEIFVSLGGLKS